jgi:hypothetical protein
MTQTAFSHTNTAGNTYFLHRVTTTLRNGKTQILYFFAKYIDPGRALASVPAGYAVAQAKNGLPVLKKLEKI